MKRPVSPEEARRRAAAHEAELDEYDAGPPDATYAPYPQPDRHQQDSSRDDCWSDQDY